MPSSSLPSLTRIGSAIPLACLLLSLSLGQVAAVRAAVQSVRLENQQFDWGEASQDQVTYRWSAEAVNDSDGSQRVEVVFQMLDDDDQIVHRDSVTVTLQARQRRTVRQQGSLAYDRAADVVSYRFRVNPLGPGDR